ncbi:MAG TPA: phage tail sheath family protein [Spirochaetaceae bacterium]|nr:phage tail sheath family protein [Spirochaetaceae bacterium]
MPYKFPGVYVEKKTYVSQPDIDTRCVAGFVGITQKGELNKPVLVRSFDEYKQHFGDLSGPGNLPYAVAGFFQNGGDECMVVRVANLNTVKRSIYEFADGRDIFRMTVKTEGAWGNSIKVSAWRDGEGHFSLSLQRGDEVENLLHMAYSKDDERYFVRYINKNSRFVDAESIGDFKNIEPCIFQNFHDGNDGLHGITAGSFLGHYNSPADYSGLNSFRHFDEVKLLSVPDIDIFGDDYVSVFQIHYEMMYQAEEFRNRFALLDLPPNLTVDEACEWANSLDNAFAACYYPNLSMSMPVSFGGGSKVVPASGAVAGMIAKSDHDKGIYVPPAGQVLKGVTDLARKLTKPEMEMLYENKVNFFKNVRGQGVKVWGCKTLSSDTEWNMINVRRTFSAVCKYLKEETRWAVFENNNQQLQKRLVRYVTAFLLNLWRKGYLHGNTPDEAFYVRCDEETNPPENVELGILSFEVGLAIARPFEFFRVVFSADKNGSNIMTE